MALESQTISTAEIKPIFAFDASTAQALGTAHEDAHTYYDLPVISYSMPYNSASLEVAPKNDVLDIDSSSIVSILVGTTYVPNITLLA